MGIIGARWESRLDLDVYVNLKTEEYFLHKKEGRTCFGAPMFILQ